MTPEQFRRVDELFQRLIELPPDQRREMLDRECEDEEVRARVMKLLDADDATTGATALREELRQEQPRSQRPSEDFIGTVVDGRFRVRRVIGRGGMGVVYLAERTDIGSNRPVALKVVRRGIDTEEVLERFRSEQRVLDTLTHPGIARVLLAGTTDDGRPYLAMEYVEGLPIDEYCDTQELGIEERLDLFVKVCEAVHYAHQNLVVHRDIKPSNILVTPGGEPKLLDFGIAKLLNPQFQGVAITEGERGPMTPEYASPEQVRGEPVTTATDVYQLGILLYELLTGHRPYEFPKRIREQMYQVICESEPERPSTIVTRPVETLQSDGTTKSTPAEEIARLRESRVAYLRRRLSGDLDNIVLMALRKSARRRYASAEQFATDIRRHRGRLPVIARPDTVIYRVGKFVARNRVGVATAATIALLLLGGAVAVTAFWQQAERQRERAVARGDLLESMVRGYFDHHDEIADLAGSTLAREALVTTSTRVLDQLAVDAAIEPELLGPLVAEGHLKLGRLLSVDEASISRAIESYNRALEARRAAAEVSPEHPQAWLGVVEVQVQLARALANYGAGTDAETMLAEALAVLENHSLPKYPADLRRAEAIMLGAELAETRGEPAGDSYKRVIELLSPWRATRREDPRLLNLLIEAYRLAGISKQREGAYETHLEYQEIALDHARARHRLDRQSKSGQRDLARQLELASSAARMVASHERKRGAPGFERMLRTAEELLRERESIVTSLRAADPLDANADWEYWHQRELEANIADVRGDWQRVIELLDPFVQHAARAAQEEGAPASRLQGVAAGNAKLASAYRELKRFSDAVPAFERSLKAYETLLAGAPEDLGLVAEAADAGHEFARMRWFEMQERDAATVDVYAEAVERFERLEGRGIVRPRMAGIYREYAYLLNTLAAGQPDGIRRQDNERALSLLERAMQADETTRADVIELHLVVLDALELPERTTAFCRIAESRLEALESREPNQEALLRELQGRLSGADPATQGG